MALLSTVVGFSFAGLAARLGQLSIQGKNLYTNPGGHAISMGVFGAIGYYAYQWEIRSAELIQLKKQQILEARRQEQ